MDILYDAWEKFNKFQVYFSFTTDSNVFLVIRAYLSFNFPIHKWKKWNSTDYCLYIFLSKKIEVQKIVRNLEKYYTLWLFQEIPFNSATH